MFFLWLGLWCATGVVMLLALMAVHEAAHALAALLLTRQRLLVRFVHPYAGRFTLRHARWRAGRLLIEEPRDYPRFIYLSIENPAVVPRLRYGLILAAGPCVSLLLGLAGGWYFVHSLAGAHPVPSGSGWLHLALVYPVVNAAACFALIVGAQSILPVWRIGPLDVWQILHLLRGGSLDHATLDAERRRRRSYPKPPALSPELAPWRLAFPDHAATVTDIITSDGRLEVHLTLTGTHACPLVLPPVGLSGVIPPTGRRVAWRETAIYALDEWETPLSVRVTPHRGDLLTGLGVAFAEPARPHAAA